MKIALHRSLGSDFGPTDAGPERLDAIAARAVAEEGRAGCTLEPQIGGARIEIWGALPLTWCGNLALHCHAASVNVVELDARRLARGRWAVSGLLAACSADARIAARDFLAMARHRPALVPSQPRIRIGGFELGEAKQGVAPLRVRAQDRLGLLAGLCDAIVSCGLRPRELWIRTRAGWAEDWILLESALGTAPLEASIDALSRSLRQAIQPAAPPSRDPLVVGAGRAGPRRA